MCGIWFYAELRSSAEPATPHVPDRIRFRGPDHVAIYEWTIQISLSSWLHVSMAASVLHMQGDILVEQPVSIPGGGVSAQEQNCLAWNGELYDTIYGSDTQAVVDLVCQKPAGLDVSEWLAAEMYNYPGPWALLLFNPVDCTVHFGRDFIGRRSLVLSHTPTSICISSVSVPAHACCEEVRPGIVRTLQLKTMKTTAAFSCKRQKHYRRASHAWASFPIVCHNLLHNGLLEKGIQTTLRESAAGALEMAASALLQHLSRAVQRRVRAGTVGPGPSPPGITNEIVRVGGIRVSQASLRSVENDMGQPARVAVMFSGGIDCMLCAALAHLHVPIEETIDLITVAFAQTEHDAAILHVDSPDRSAAMLGLSELQRSSPGRIWRLICVNEDLQSLRDMQTTVMQLNSPRDSAMDFSIAAALWAGARGIGWVRCDGQNLPAIEPAGEPSFACSLPLSLAAAGIGNEYSCHASSLFDQAVSVGTEHAATLQDDAAGTRNPIVKDTVPADHTAMAAETEAIGCSAASTASDDYSSTKGTECGAIHRMQLPSCVPEQFFQSSVCAYDHACCYAPSGAATAATSAATTETCALDENGFKYALVRSAARVVLLGMGADEQCGGYGRHLTAFNKGREILKGSGKRSTPGWQALHDEMDMDVQRIWQRNLGRDDRVVSDHGREARFPFLDEDVCKLLAELPLPLLTEPRLERGFGDKRIIRLAGAMIGLENSSRLVKRAIQFGSRVARVTNKAILVATTAAAGGDTSTITGRSAMKLTRGTDAFTGLH
jgi:asparagine synthetase B (glutamine-hydrolysing)